MESMFKNATHRLQQAHRHCVMAQRCRPGVFAAVGPSLMHVCRREIGTSPWDVCLPGPGPGMLLVRLWCSTTFLSANGTSTTLTSGAHAMNMFAGETCSTELHPNIGGCAYGVHVQKCHHKPIGGPQCNAHGVYVLRSHHDISASRK
jgi:hypothetical protein